MSFWEDTDGFWTLPESGESFEEASASLKASLTVAQGSVSLPASAIIRHDALLDVKGKLFVGGDGYGDVKASIFIVNSDAESLPARLTVIHSSSSELKATTLIRQSASSDLRCRIEVWRSVRDLRAHLRVSLATKSVYNLEQSQTYQTTSGSAVYGTNWVTQTFTPNTSTVIRAVSLALYRYGASPPDLNIAIKATDVNGKPTGADLTSGTFPASRISASTYQPRLIELTPYTLAAGTLYAIVISPVGGGGDSSNYFVVGYFGYTSLYARGQRGLSSNAGVTWNMTIYDLFFGTYINDGLKGRLFIGFDGSTNLKCGLIIRQTSEVDDVALLYNSTYYFYGSSWRAQTFIARQTRPIGAVTLYFAKSGSGAPITVSIRATSSHMPTGADLTSTTIPATTDGITRVNLPPYLLTRGVEYAMVIRGTGGPSDYHSLRVYYYPGINTSPEYYSTSSNSGVSWGLGSGYKAYFQIHETTDLKGVVSIRHASSSSLKGKLSVRRSSSQNVKARAFIGSLGSAALKCSLLVIHTATRDLKSKVHVQHIGASDVKGRLFVGLSGGRDVKGVLSLRKSPLGRLLKAKLFVPQSSLNLKAKLSVANGSTAALKAKMNVATPLASDLPAAIVVRSSGAADLHFSLIVINPILNASTSLKASLMIPSNLKCALFVIHPYSNARAEVKASLDVMQSNAADLRAHLEVRQTSRDLLCKLYVGFVDAGDLPCLLTVVNQSSATLKGALFIPPVGSASLPASIFVYKPYVNDSADVKCVLTVQQPLVDSADVKGALSVIRTSEANLLCALEVNRLVGASDLPASLFVQNAGASSLIASIFVYKPYVNDSADVKCVLTVQQPLVDSADVKGILSVSRHVEADLKCSLDIHRLTDARDLPASLFVTNLGAASLPASIFVYKPYVNDSADVKCILIVQQTVVYESSEDLACALYVVGRVAANLPASIFVLHEYISEAVDVAAAVYVRQTYSDSSSLKAKLEVTGGFSAANLKASITVVPHSSSAELKGSLFVDRRYEDLLCSLNVRNTTDVYTLVDNSVAWINYLARVGTGYLGVPVFTGDNTLTILVPEEARFADEIIFGWSWGDTMDFTVKREVALKCVLVVAQPPGL